MLKYRIVFVFLSLTLFQQAQDQNNYQLGLNPKDSLYFKHKIPFVYLEVQARSFAMRTINEGDLEGGYALGLGAGMSLLTQAFYHFQLGATGFIHYNLFSSDLAALDSITNFPNRYEVGLFNIEDPGSKGALMRLEELYLKYSFSKSSLSFGRINLNTPFFNPQDGRMRSTYESGIWLSLLESSKFGFSGGWIWETSPRSTIQWFSVAGSMGLYPNGVNPNGSKSNYANNIEGCSGMGIANVYFAPFKNLKFNFWNGYLENVMNTAILEINLDQKRDQNKFYQGILFMHQDALNNGGNSDPTKTYMTKGSSSNALSAQLGLKRKKMNYTINYTRIFSTGRYLMPREWGKDVFYTFLPRERNEGFGDVHAVMAKAILLLHQNKLRTSVGIGYYNLPDVKNTTLNKYGFPSYYQFNYDFSFKFSKMTKGLELRFLVAYKLNAGNIYGNLKYVDNKVNMVNFNLIFDYKI